MTGHLLLRGMIAGLVAGLIAFGFARLYGEPQVDRAIAFEELMAAAEAQARMHGKTLICLDTATGSPAEAIYTHLNWLPVGVIPNYALFPDGSPCATTLFYKGI